MSKQRNTSQALPSLYAMVLPGLEPIAAEELEHSFDAEIKRAGAGFVVFRVPEITSQILRPRTTEDIFLLAWGTDELTYRAEDLKRIESWTARKPDWQRLLSIHHAVRPKPSGKPTYRIVAQMEGVHGYRRTDARDAMVRGLAGVIPPSWRHAEENAALEIWLSINEATAVCGVRLSDRTMRHRTYKKEHMPASLRPTVAAAMVHIAGLQRGEVVLDPMCGAGTILAEVRAHARARDQALRLLVGGDSELEALRNARANLHALGIADFCCWDARWLPLAEQSIDCIISNPPFGKQLASPEEIEPLYRGMVSAYQRVLRRGARAVLLVADFKMLREAAAAVGWKLHRQLQVRVLGQRATLSVWRT